jgi:hypothetical protein
LIYDVGQKFRVKWKNINEFMRKKSQKNQVGNRKKYECMIVLNKLLNYQC